MEMGLSSSSLDPALRPLPFLLSASVPSPGSSASPVSGLAVGASVVVEEAAVVGSGEAVESYGVAGIKGK